jgi:hypothetical protein
MYVRWVVRNHKNSAIADTSFHDAYLVKSYRDERGSPRQRTICYLGNIRKIGGEFPAIERELFLLRAERIIQSIDELSAEDCVQIMEMLHQKVHPLTPPEVLTAFTENLRWYRRWWAEHGGAPSEEDLHRLVSETRGKPGPM